MSLPKQKKSRIIFSCKFYRKRKIKCDRKQPCSNCVKFRVPSCTYDIEHGSSSTLKCSFDSDPNPATEIQFLKSRLEQLENFVNDPPKLHHSHSMNKHHDGKPLAHNSGIANVRSFSGNNPMDFPDEVINFYEGYTPVIDKVHSQRKNSNPFSCITLMRFDNALAKIWNYAHGLIQQDIGQFSQRKFNAEEMPHEDSSKNNINTDLKGSSNMTERKGQFKDSSPIGRGTPIRQMVHPNFFSVKVFNEENDEGDTEFVLNLSKYLPPSKVVWILIDCFFHKVYPFLPFIDEESFRNQISRILQHDNDNDLEGLSITPKIEQKLDIAYMGLLLVVLRFSYMALRPDISVNRSETNTMFEENQDYINLLLENPISPDVVGISKQCLSRFNILNGVNMIVFQLMLYIRLYLMYAPEEGDGPDGGNSKIFHTILVLCLYIMGLNRDPDNIPGIFADKKLSHLCRKIWYNILVTDMGNSVLLGDQLIINKYSFDTKLPYYESESSNTKNTDIEKMAVGAFKKFDVVFELISDIINTILRVQSVKIVDVVDKLNLMEIHLSDEYGNLHEYFRNKTHKNSDSFTKIIKIKVYLSFAYFFVTIYFHFFNHYERKNNLKLASHYLKKVFIMIIQDIMPFCYDLSLHGHAFFSMFTDMVVVPGFQGIIHKSATIMIAVMTRIKFIILRSLKTFDHGMKMRSDESYASNFSKLSLLYKLLEESVQILLDQITRLKHKYYYSWRIINSITYLLSNVSKDDIFNANERDAHKENFYLNNDLLDDLITITTHSVEQILPKRNTLKFLHESITSLECETNQDYRIKNSYMLPGVTTFSVKDTPLSTNLYSDQSPNGAIDNTWLEHKLLRKDDQVNESSRESCGAFSSSLNQSITGSGDAYIPFNHGQDIDMFDFFNMIDY